MSLLAEGLVAQGVEVTLFATLDSLTTAKLAGVCPRPYNEVPDLDGHTLGIARAHKGQRVAVE